MKFAVIALQEKKSEASNNCCQSETDLCLVARTSVRVNEYAGVGRFVRAGARCLDGVV